MARALKIGVDIGGTEAALLCGSTAMGSFKLPTTDDVMTGVRNAVATLIS